MVTFRHSTWAPGPGAIQEVETILPGRRPGEGYVGSTQPNKGGQSQETQRRPHYVPDAPPLEKKYKISIKLRKILFIYNKSKNVK